MTDAVADILDIATIHGGALVRFIRPNDVGATGSHQFGFHLPKDAWPYYTPHRPEKGLNSNHEVEVEWGNGVATRSTVKWYGKGTRAEYRLTGFNRITNFYALDHSNIGALLVLVRVGNAQFRASIISNETDIELVSAQLGIDLVTSGWGEYKPESPRLPTSVEEHALVEALVRGASFPKTELMAATARQVVHDLHPAREATADVLLMDYLAAEYAIFRAIESAAHSSQVLKGFRSVDEFLSLAQSMTQRRKSRAGKSLEFHVEAVLELRGIPFESQPNLDGTTPDLVIPSSRVYEQIGQGVEPYVVAIKTTCRDRWRQVTEEAPKAAVKYLFTTQHGISISQLDQIEAAGIQLIVPAVLHLDYPKERVSRIWSFEQFLSVVEPAFGTA